MHIDVVSLRPFCMTLSVSEIHRLGAWHKMAAIAVQISIALLLLVSSDWMLAHKGSDEDGVHVGEAEEGPPTYNFGKTTNAFAWRLG